MIHQALIVNIPLYSSYWFPLVKLSSCMLVPTIWWLTPIGNKQIIVLQTWSVPMLNIHRDMYIDMCPVLTSPWEDTIVVILKFVLWLTVPMVARWRLKSSLKDSFECNLFISTARLNQLLISLKFLKGMKDQPLPGQCLELIMSMRVCMVIEYNLNVHPRVRL